MHIHENVSLKDHSTMRLGGNARYLVDIESTDDAVEAVAWAKEHKVPFLVIGRGSNIVWRDEGYDGLIMVNKIPGRQVMSEDESSATLSLASGENWDEVVAWSVEQNLTGLEFLSLIPGTVGAAPIQNIGAYGGELSSVLLEVQTYDSKENCFIGLMSESCDFGYRTSRFKTTDHGRFIITGVVVKLKKANPAPPFYESLQAYLDEHGFSTYTPNVIRNAVIAIRSSKLPDPEKVSNNGSFFTNPVIGDEQFSELQKKYPGIKGWLTDDGQVKLAAGYLVEQAGFRGVHDEATGMATYEKQALVLVNEHANSTADLLAFRQKIIDKVHDMFDVTLEQEPELLP